MKKLLIALALASAAVTAPVAAQQLPPAVIVVVNIDNVITNSAAGKAAFAELKTRSDGIQARTTQLQNQLGAEQQTLETSRPTAPGPAATAWEAKAKDFSTRAQAAQNELAKRNQDLQLSQRYVISQINDQMQPIITQIMKERGANIAIAEGARLQHAAALDITADILARLDKALPRVATTPPAAPAAPAPAK
ncbi:MAG: hypothetical protein CFE37_09165 [Alphaproteobacteria bacterium PA4]|nr:MAG: hypothetical protein CFE37_09165 [Alphaproteobacteria bacterium PA4]